jgi:TPR repeat protein
MGDGIPLSVDGMLKWYHLAADQDVPEAKLRLGIIYGHGKGFTRDHAEGHYWLSAAVRDEVQGAKPHLIDLENRIDPAKLAGIRQKTQARLRKSPPAAKAPAQQKESS